MKSRSLLAPASGPKEKPRPAYEADQGSLIWRLLISTGGT
jgi:hypothetical protein